MGKPCFASVDALPQGVDVAVLAIPRAGVLDAGAAAQLLDGLFELDSATDLRPLFGRGLPG